MWMSYEETKRTPVNSWSTDTTSTITCGSSRQTFKVSKKDWKDYLLYDTAERNLEKRAQSRTSIEAKKLERPLYMLELQ